MVHRIFNASNVLGATAFLAMIAAVGAYEGGRYILAIALVAVFAGCAHMSIKEDGKNRGR